MKSARTLGKRSEKGFSLLLLGIIVSGCSIRPDSRLSRGAAPLASAEAFVDSFYSFDPVRLRGDMSGAPASMPQILYYQGWAEGGNYRVLDRKPCRFDTAQEVSCAITVQDDLITALGTGYHVTDTFHLSFQGGRIVGVRTTSDDPPEFDQALDWLRQERPTLMQQECRGFFKGGPTPQDCVRSVVKGFTQFTARRRRS